MAVLDHELQAEGARPLAARHRREAATLVERCVPRHVEIGREIERIVSEFARPPGGTIDQCRPQAAPLPAIQHRELVEPGGAARKLHQGKADDAVQWRDRDPQPAVASALLERGNAGRRHCKNLRHPATRIAFVGCVFDLRQQSDFVGTGGADHRGVWREDGDYWGDAFASPAIASDGVSPKEVRNVRVRWAVSAKPPSMAAVLTSSPEAIFRAACCRPDHCLNPRNVWPVAALNMRRALVLSICSLWLSSRWVILDIGSAIRS